MRLPTEPTCPTRIGLARCRWARRTRVDEPIDDDDDDALDFDDVTVPEQPRVELDLAFDPTTLVDCERGLRRRAALRRVTAWLWASGETVLARPARRLRVEPTGLAAGLSVLAAALVGVLIGGLSG
jgi:hypothetical protein